MIVQHQQVRYAWKSTRKTRIILVFVLRHHLRGFPQYKNYVLIQPEADSTFYWLQSLEAADLAFVVTDPLLFVPDYQVPLREETRQDLGLAGTDLAEASILVIVNKVGDTLTANLQGPLVIHATTRAAAQVVISEKKYQTRHIPILQPCSAPARADADRNGRQPYVEQIGMKCIGNPSNRGS